MRKEGEWIHGKYRVDRVLGSGGMGTVYATTRRNGSRAAVKVLHPRFAADKSIRARFLQEGYLANKIDHPAVVTILEDDIDEEGNFYLVMELLHGVDLGKFVGPPRTNVSLSDALNITDQLLSALVLAHQKGIVHRDIKPANVMLLRDGRVKLLDFGIAQVLSDKTLRSELDDDDEEEEDDDDVVLGTDRYMSPEQGKGFLEEIDARSDLWAVGALMLALLAEEQANTVPLWDQNYEDRAWAFSRLGAVPPHIVQIISLALQPLKSKRWASAAAMQTAVRAAHTDLFGPARREKLALLVTSISQDDPSLTSTIEPVTNHPSANQLDPTEHSPRESRPEASSSPPPSSDPPGLESIPTRPKVSVPIVSSVVAFFIGIVALALWSNRVAPDPKPTPGKTEPSHHVLPPPESTHLRDASDGSSSGQRGSHPLPRPTRENSEIQKPLTKPPPQKNHPHPSPRPKGIKQTREMSPIELSQPDVGSGGGGNNPGPTGDSTPTEPYGGMDDTFDPGGGG